MQILMPSLFIVSLFLNHQAKLNDRSKPVRISGNIQGGTIKKIYLAFDADRTSIGDADNNISIWIKPDSTGHFDLPLPKIDFEKKINFLNISTETFDLNMHNYVVEPGDSVVINIKYYKDSADVRFVGTGAQKFNCRRLLELKEAALQEELHKYYQVFGNEKKWRCNDLAFLNKIYQRTELYENSILTRFKKRMHSATYNILKADAISYLMGYRDLEYAAVLKKNKIIQKEIIRYNYRIIDIKNMHFSPDYLAATPDYIEFLTSKAALSIMLFNKDHQPIGFDDLFNFIKSAYNGALRDRILYNLFVNPQSPHINENLSFCTLDASIKAKYIKTALSFISSNIMRRKMLEVQNQSMVGSPAYDFFLPDSLGHKFRLSDFKGKVVIMDLWYTGCSGCVQFAKKMKEDIKPHFTDTTNFIILSICADKDRTVWLKSITTDLYTEGDNINLYTEGKGFEHELVKHYDLVGLPFALLIDKNNRIFEDITFLDKDRIISKINSALK